DALTGSTTRACLGVQRQVARERGARLTTATSLGTEYQRLESGSCVIGDGCGSVVVQGDQHGVAQADALVGDEQRGRGDVRRAADPTDADAGLNRCGPM